MSDELWAQIEPLVPVIRRRADHPGRRRLRHHAGVWQRLHQNLLAELNAAGALDWSRMMIDGMVQAAVGELVPQRQALVSAAQACPG